LLLEQFLFAAREPGRAASAGWATENIHIHLFSFLHKSYLYHLAIQATFSKDKSIL
jgi:hypothetical protein